MEKLDGKSMNIVEQNIEQLKELFPEVFSEGKIKFSQLQEVLGKYVVDNEDHYNFTWHGKRKTGRLAQTPSTGTLRPAKDESVDWDTTQNLFIEGDNLEVLKLLQKSYHRKVKVIYIDPPYNTGNDFVYEDDFKDGVKSYLEITGQLDSEGKKMGTNSSTAGRYHTNWLNMMYPRLRLARNLLHDNGVIFISIDDNELANLKKLCDEVFGENNFIEVFSWVKTSTPPALSTKSRKTNEYILCYEKFRTDFKYKGEGLDGGDQPLLNSGNSTRTLIFSRDTISFNQTKFPDGEYSPSKPGRVEVVSSFTVSNGKNYTPVTLSGEFKWTQRFLDEEIGKGTKFVIKSEAFSIRFIRDEHGFKRPTNFIKEKYTSPFINKNSCSVETNESASGYLSQLMGGDYFDYPKPASLIKYLFEFITNEGDLVMDFFAGSGTTAESVMRSCIDIQNCKYILVQLPEVLDPSIVMDRRQKEKTKNAIEFLASIGKPHNIAELCKERIRRAAKKIKEEHPGYDGDLGFKVFKLNSSNIKHWEADFDTLEKDLLNAVDYIKQERSNEDVLYEILLKYGLDLTVPIETRTIAGKTVYSIDSGALIVCLDKDVSMDVVNGIGALKDELDPEIMCVVFKDEGFRDDVVKTNAIQALKRFDIQDIKSL